MGNNFLSKVAKPFKKRWEKQLQNQKTPDLLSPLPNFLETIRFKPEKEYEFEVGKTYLVCVKNNTLSVYYNTQQIGYCNSPPPSLLHRIVNQHGRAVGQVITVHSLTKYADISIQLAQGG